MIDSMVVVGLFLPWFAIFSGFPHLSVSSVDSVNQVVIKRSSSVNY